MWIKEPPAKLGVSLNENVNFLYNVGNIYIMDNHLAAGWSWLQEVDGEIPHNYLHIDRHYDLLGFKKTIQTQVIDKGINLHELSFQEYLELRQLGNNGDQFQMFRWDNYILNLSYAYPNLFQNTFFATHDEGNREDYFINEDLDFLRLLSDVDSLIDQYGDQGWILNLDIDYFYSNIGEVNIQVIDDEYIIQLVLKIRKVIDKLTVFTICLSPECCGGWQNSIKKTEIICDVLDLDFITLLSNKSSH
ncbi:peptide arginase family protein [Sediminicola luteus]|uniref:Uncharacterized protein n=1 Tax=Sediminicola luteus TaxID=319238 RepID=A0A2A4G849_9FLAO|nr:hypothetical protein [Sediminicola luteus]PCE64144.1 hypothetical protein B7P33_13015 [Sediminicola luteus]